jgi:hypothetical protein
LRNLPKDVLKATGEALRSATRQVISDLQDAGPAYSGNFRSKWYSQVEGRGNKVFASVGVPRFKEQDLRRGAPTILIGNTAPYAQEAMDLIPGKFIAQKDDPAKTPVATGKRVGAFRGDVRDMSFEEMADSGVKRPAISTAEPKWYEDYMNGGGFSNAFKQGARTGFIRPVQQ